MWKSDVCVLSCVSCAMVKGVKGCLEGPLQAGTSAVSDKVFDWVGLGVKGGPDKYSDTHAYLAASCKQYTGLWRAGAKGESAGMITARSGNQQELNKMKQEKQKNIPNRQQETHTAKAHI